MIRAVARTSGLKTPLWAIVLLGALGAAPLAAQETEEVDISAAETAQIDPGAIELTEEMAAAAAALPDVFEDQDDWSEFSARAGEAIADARASNSAFADLRVELDRWRDVFLDRESTNSARIETLRSQISALGDVPDTGEEDARVVARRAELTTQLQAAQAPSKLASEAYAEADGLIREIDSIVRERQTSSLTERVQSPLNPAGWTGAVDALWTALGAQRLEVKGRIETPSLRSAFIGQLPASLSLLALALVLVLRGRYWFAQLAERVLRRVTRGKGAAAFFLSLGQVIVPLAGLLALSSALELTGLLGRRTAALADALPLYGMYPVVAHWLAGLVFPGMSEDGAQGLDMQPLQLPGDQAARAYRRFVILGYAMMAFGFAGVFVEANSFNAQTAAIVLFPFGFLMAWTLYWLGHKLRHSPEPEEPEDRPSFRQTLRSLLSRGVMIVALVSVILAALGYSAAFDAFAYPAGITLFVLGALLVLQRLSVDVYNLLSKSESGAQDALIPVVIGFALILFALPVLALVWGAQVTDITELWTRFKEGFSIGSTQISPSSFLLFAVVFGAGYTITRLIQAALRSTVLPRTKLDIGGQNAIVSGFGYVGFMLAALLAITWAGIDLSGLAIVAGALSVGIGFGLQNIVSNFVSGIILLIERPIGEGDWIEVGGQMGYVRDISVRSTRIETFDRRDVIVPNSDLVSGQVTNWTRGNNVGRVIVPVGVAYGTDTDRVAGLLQKIAEAHPMVVMNPPPNVIFQGFGADSLDFEIRAILRDVNRVLAVKSELNHAIAKKFAEENIEIPFAQRDLWLRNPETLNFVQNSALKQNSAAVDDIDAGPTDAGAKPEDPNP